MFKKLYADVKIGDIYGELKVIEEVEPYENPNNKNKIRQWKCECSCSYGDFCIIRGVQLKNGERTCCKRCSFDKKGLKHSKYPRVKVGDSFNDLTVISLAPMRKSESGASIKYWLLECKCGNKIELQDGQIKRKENANCGNCNPVKVGDSFNNIEVISYFGIKKSSNGSKHKYWNVRCSCGKIYEMLEYAIKNKKSFSCGKCYDILNGKSFKRWTVLHQSSDKEYFTKNNKKIKTRNWVCQCSCVNKTIKTVPEQSLLNGDSRSCGCYMREMASINGKKSFMDLTGKTFNRLKVLNRVFIIDKRTSYLCECSCGNTIIVDSGHLKNNHTQSCGCYAREQLSKNNLINLEGLSFGYIDVLKINSERNKNKKVTYSCRCNYCESVFSISGDSLRSGSRSCGCLKESYVAIECKKYFSKNCCVILEYKIFRNPETNHFLPYDLYFPNENLFVEINGSQHYEISAWNSDSNDFLYDQYKDKIKKEFAEENGKFLEIDLRKIKTFEEARDIILEYLS